jgi:hypothetical protein
MATTARLMIEKCDCHAAPCVCSTTPYLSRIDAVTASATRDRSSGLDRPDGSHVPEKTVVVHPILRRALERCGFHRCADDVRLSQRQMDTLMTGRDIAQRIELKQLIDLAGIWPKAPR